MPTDGGTTRFLDIEFANMTNASVATELDRLSRLDEFSFVVTPNVDHIVMLDDGTDKRAIPFREAYATADLQLCDSRVLQALAKLRGVELSVVTGSDLTHYLFENGHLDGRKVALIGGDRQMMDELGQRFPSIELAQHIPPMGVLSNESAIAKIENFIADTRADFVFFAIGAPQSEIIAHRCKSSTRCRGVALCIGASIEFILGRKARAPRWMQNLRLEWAFRLMREPGRLWRRYLVVGPRVFRIVSSAD